MALAVQDSPNEPNSPRQETHDRPGPLKGKGTEIELKPSAEFKWLVQEFERSKTKTDQVLLSTRPNSEPTATALGAEASYQPKLTTVELCTSRPDKLHNWDYPKVDAYKNFPLRAYIVKIGRKQADANSTGSSKETKTMTHVHVNRVEGPSHIGCAT